MSAPHTITRRALLTATSTLGVATLAHVAAAHADASPPYSGWRLVPSATDEFGQFDADRWRTHLWYATSGVGAFSPANVTVARSNLVLTAQQERYHDKSYTFGAVESTFNIPGGPSYVEVRGKVLDSRANVLSAIWMQSSPLSSQKNPNPEIDIQETFDYFQLDSHLHRWILTSSGTTHIDDGGNAYNTGIPDISSGYHLYGLERRADRLRFYFDRRLAWEVTPPDPTYVDMPRHLVLSLEGHLGQPNDAYLPGRFLIDYVRTYQPS